MSSRVLALHDRGTKRDFVDVHAICSRPGWSMGRFIELAVSRLPFQPMQVRRAMTYFADAERADARGLFRSVAQGEGRF